MNRFDEKAKGWDSNPSNMERAESIAKAILVKRHFKPGVDALEYGCGTGLLSFALSERLGRIDLADSSDGMLDVLKEKIVVSQALNMRPIRLDLMVDPLPEDRYGLIFTQMTLHHIKDIPGILGKFHALLKSDGLLFVADLDEEDGSFHKTHPAYDGHNGFARENLAGMAKTAGFREIEFETVYDQRKEIDGEIRSFPVFLMSAKA